MVHLLSVFAQYLADVASDHAISPQANDPKSVSDAKQFVLAHVEEPIMLARVAKMSIGTRTVTRIPATKLSSMVHLFFISFLSTCCSP